MAGTTRARAGSDWLALREPADATARSAELVEVVRANLPSGEPIVIHDLGCGTGSMVRWLAPRLAGPQRWVLHDWDRDLLALATAGPPPSAREGIPVTIETRRDDVTRLEPGALDGAALVCASALLDVLTADEVERLVTSCVEAECPVLLTLTVTGRVELMPRDPFDQPVSEAFNAHQRRMTEAGRLLGPRAVDTVVDSLVRRGLDVTSHPSPWRLGPERVDLAARWLTGWLEAACEHRPQLEGHAPSYARRRLASAATGGLVVTVHHEDVLARPRWCLDRERR